MNSNFSNFDIFAYFMQESNQTHRLKVVAAHTLNKNYGFPRTPPSGIEAVNTAGIPSKEFTIRIGTILLSLSVEMKRFSPFSHRRATRALEFW